MHDATFDLSDAAAVPAPTQAECDLFWDHEPSYAAGWVLRYRTINGQPPADTSDYSVAQECDEARIQGAIRTVRTRTGVSSTTPPS